MSYSTNELIELGQKRIMKCYRPMPAVITGGHGATLSDKDGNEYIDLASGIAVSSLGYGHRGLAEAIKAQVDKVLHTSNIIWNEPSILLADKIVQHSFGDRVFFCNSGAEASEAMIKLARRYFYLRNESRTEIITMDKAFHGRTTGMLSCTGQASYREGFAPFIPDIKHIPFNNIGALKETISRNTAAVLIEPILGEGGLIMPDKNYLAQVRALCNEYGALMLLDEVQSGVGRTGQLFAYEDQGFEPDAMALAKGLGGGMPIGAIVTKEEFAPALAFPAHGSTFGGNPLACAAGLVVMEEFTKPQRLAEIRRLGSVVEHQLSQFKAKLPELVVAIRGKGLWFGVELVKEPVGLTTLALEHGIMLNMCAKKVIRIAPPLVIDEQTLTKGLSILLEVLVKWSSNQAVSA